MSGTLGSLILERKIKTNKNTVIIKKVSICHTNQNTFTKKNKNDEEREHNFYGLGKQLNYN